MGWIELAFLSRVRVYCCSQRRLLGRRTSRQHVMYEEREFVDVHLKPALLERYHLPEIAYPILKSAFDAQLLGAGQLSLDLLLFSLQLKSRDGGSDWEGYEPAMERLAELLAPARSAVRVQVQGEGWKLALGEPPPRSTKIAVNRGRTCVALISPSEQGWLRLSAYRPLDGKCADLLLDLAQDPMGGRVCFRDSNWDYALDCAAGMGQMYAEQRGESYLSILLEDQAIDASASQEAVRCPEHVATELRVFERFSRPIDVNYP